MVEDGALSLLLIPPWQSALLREELPEYLSEALSQFLFGAIGNCHPQKTLGILSLGMFSSSTPLSEEAKTFALYWVASSAFLYSIIYS